VPLSPFAFFAGKGSQVLAQPTRLDRRQRHWRIAIHALRTLVLYVEHKLLPRLDGDERFSPRYSESIIVHFWALLRLIALGRQLATDSGTEPQGQAISRAVANSWAQTCHESASLARYFKCQREAIYGSLAKGPSISVSFQRYRGPGGWHGGIVGGARVLSAARPRLDWPSCFRLRIELQWFPPTTSDEGC
jgi:hypothetical protein